MVRVAIALLCFLLALLPSAAHAQNRIALLIGNKDYKPGVGALVNPLNDTRLVGDALKAVGFEVLRPNQNATRSAMLLAVHAFAARLKAAGPDAVGFLYYSGHGLASEGENYLVPVDVEEPSTINLRVQGVKQSEMLAILRSEAPNAAHYLILDACRNTLQGTRGGKGFVPVGQQSGVLVAFSTEPGKTASDVGASSGPYAAALAAELVKPGQIDLVMFHNVRVAVIQKTKGDQVPWTEDGIQRPQRMLFGGENKLPPAPAQPAALPRLSDAEAWDRAKAVAPNTPTYEQQAELAFWASVKDSKDPETLEMYLKQFPNGIFAGLARLMISQVRREVEQRAIQSAHEEAARDAGLKRQNAETQRIEAELKVRTAEAAKQQGELVQALEEARKAREELKAAENNRRAAQTAAQEARRAAEELESEREAQTEAAQKWGTVKETVNVVVLEDFIRRYGKTVFGAIAQARLNDVKKQQAAASTASTKSAEPAKLAVEEARKRAESEAQAKAEQAVRQRLATLQKQQEDEKKVTEAKIAQRPAADLLPTDVLRAKLATASVLRSLAVSPGGSELAISADDGLIRIIDVPTFRQIRHFPNQSDGVITKTLAYSGDGSLIIAGRQNGKVELWNVAAGSRAGELKSNSNKVLAVAYYPPELHRYAVTAGSDGVEIWNMRTKSVAGRPGLHNGAVRALAYSSEKSGIFVSGGEDGQLIFYLPGNRQKPVQAHRGGVFGAAFSLDNDLVVSGGADGLVKTWNSKTQSEKHAFQGHTRYVLSVALSKSGSRIASGGGDKSVRIWDVHTGKPVHVLEGHEKDVEYVGFLNGDDLVVSVSEDKTLRLWDGVHGRQLLTAAFYADGNYVAYTTKGLFTGTAGSEVRLEVGTGSQPRPLSETELRNFKPEGLAVAKLAGRQ